jgi:hypothetical protein
VTGLPAGSARAVITMVVAAAALWIVASIVGLWIVGLGRSIH